MSRLKFCAVILPLMLAACGQLAPAATPPQLAHTPGPAVTILKDLYQGPGFWAWYPPGWLVITAPAFSAPWVIFVEPEQRALIVLAMDTRDVDVQPEGTPPDQLRQQRVLITLEDGTVLTAALVAPVDDPTYDTLFQRVLDSLTAG